jgi:Fe-S-cluster formation regulator IscX/YfhJ
MKWTDIRKVFAASVGLKRRDNIGGVGVLRAILLKWIFGK